MLEPTNSVHSAMKILFFTVSLCLLHVVAAQTTLSVSTSTPISPGGIQTGGELGFRVAADGDYTVASAPLDARSGHVSGVVKVFNSTTGKLLFTLTSPGVFRNVGFGSSVAISGNRLATGAPFDDTGKANAGSVFVYDLNSAVLNSPSVMLNNPSPDTDDNFGISVALTDRYLVAGAPSDSKGAPSAGSVYVYDLLNSALTVPVHTIHNPNPIESAHFGFAVAISGTFLVVGTQSEHKGSAFVYDLSGDRPSSPIATLPMPGPPKTNSISISGTRVLIGTPLNKVGVTSMGSVYVYELSSRTPEVPAAMLINPRKAVSDGYGHSVSISGNNVVIGAHQGGMSADDSGRAYVYDLGGDTPTAPVATLLNLTPTANDFFGSSVAIFGSRLVVGAPQDDTGAVNSGSAYVYDISGTKPDARVVSLHNSAQP